MARRSSWTQVPAEPSATLRSVAKVRSSETVLRTRIIAIFAILGLAAISGPIALLSNATSEPPSVNVYKAVPQGLGVASTAARDYLAGHVFTVPVASGIDNASPSSQAMPPGTTYEWNGFYISYMGGEAARPMEVHKFLVITAPLDSGGNPKRDQDNDPIVIRRMLQVPVMITDAGAVLGALPSLIAYEPATADGTYAEGQVTASDIPGLKASVDEWARAYAAGDGDLLFRRSGAPAAYQDAFSGLGSYQAGGSQILGIVPLDETGDAYIARIRVPMAWVDPLTGEAGPRTTVDYDLLINGARSGNPTVPSWGPAGTGAYLSPYSTARTVAPVAAS